MTWLLGGVAAVSLVVGGIGIMNIMLVSVTERTREIGIRMAIGARGSDILAQFLIEAVVLSMLGGIIGIVIGVGVAYGAKALAGWAISVPPWSIGLAFGFSAAVGIFFGIYPARKASQARPDRGAALPVGTAVASAQHGGRHLPLIRGSADAGAVHLAGRPASGERPRAPPWAVEQPKRGYVEMSELAYRVAEQANGEPDHRRDRDGRLDGVAAPGQRRSTSRR